MMTTFGDRIKRLSYSKREYVFNLPRHLSKAENLLQLQVVLTDPEFLESKISHGNTRSVIEDFDLCLRDSVVDQQRESLTLDIEGLRLLRDAMRLSLHILDRQPCQLKSQMLGRLLNEEAECVRRFLNDAIASASAISLLPISRSLISPKFPLYRTLVGHSDKVVRVIINGEGSIVISAAEDGCLKGWCLVTGEELWSHQSMGNRIDIGADGRQLVVVARDGTVKRLDVETGRVIGSVPLQLSGVNGVTACPDGNKVLLSLNGKSVQGIDLRDGSCFLKLDKNSDDVVACTVNNDCQKAITASSDGFLQLWDLSSGNELRKIEAQAGWRHRPAFSRRGSRVVSGVRTNAIMEWDLESGQCTQALEGHRSFVSSVVVVGGSCLLSASWDKTVRLWDLYTGKQIKTFIGHSDWVNDLAVTPDMQLVVSASSDATVKVWKLNTIDL
ncbi:WD40 repeat domain-containing protein [Planctomycetota bacterium]